MSAPAMQCPICGQNSKTVRDLPTEAIRTALIEYYDQEPRVDLDLQDYKMQRCVDCGLEFASPMVPGSASFYEYVTSQAGYFPQERWEWNVVIDRISDLKDGTLLEIGCGSGLFLERVKAKTKLRPIGLDLTHSVVELCRRKNLEVYEGKIEDWGKGDLTQRTKVDVAVAFHCLEHVEDPLGFVKAIADATTQEGRIYLSTPYSPMAFEDMWYDPMNHPPHHMTRWTRSAYDRLAKELHMTAKFFMPAAASLASRTLASLTLAGGLQAQQQPLATRMLMGAVRPIRLVRAFWHQLNRERVNGQVAADVVLVEMTQ
jgi:2-polyprenyl-3-methyl-5-hydroxy-6-metoxy-1,4-benzoquinol methylase